MSIDPANPQALFHAASEKGRTKIAFGQHYIGDVKTYNAFSKAFAGKKAMDVEINGKIYHVNIKSFTNFLKNNGYEPSPLEVRQIRSMNELEGKLNINENAPLLRDQLSHQKTKRLWKKMVIAMSKGEEPQAISMMYRGANLVKDFIKTNNGLFLSKSTKPPKKTLAMNYNPLNFAKVNNLMLMQPHFALLGIREEDT